MLTFRSTTSTGWIRGRISRETVDAYETFGFDTVSWRAVPHGQVDVVRRVLRVYVCHRSDGEVTRLKPSITVGDSFGTQSTLTDTKSLPQIFSATPKKFFGLNSGRTCQ